MIRLGPHGVQVFLLLSESIAISHPAFVCNQLSHVLRENLTLLHKNNKGKYKSAHKPAQSDHNNDHTV